MFNAGAEHPGVDVGLGLSDVVDYCGLRVTFWRCRLPRV